VLSPQETRHRIYENCTLQKTKNLNYVIYEIWGPYYENLGGNLPNPLEIIKLSYRWGCSQSIVGYSCKTKEVFWYAKRYGLVRRERYERQPDGTMQKKSEKTFNLDYSQVEIAADARHRVRSCGPSPRVPCNEANAVRSACLLITNNNLLVITICKKHGYPREQNRK